MKKNLMSVIILALCLVNLVLSAIIVFTLVPGAQKNNKLIDEICSAIQLDLNSGAATGISNIPADEQDVYYVSATDGTKTDFTVKLKDGDNAYLVFQVSLSLNKNSDNYEKYSPTVLADQDSVIASSILEIAGNYSYEELSSSDGVAKLKNEIVTDMQNRYGKDYIIGVNFGKFTLTN